MAKFIGFPSQEESIILKAYKASREGLEKLVTELSKGTGKGTTFDTNFTKYMGTGSTAVTKESITYLEDIVKAMHIKIASLTFNVHYDASYTSANASMYSYSSVFGGQKLSVADIQDLEPIRKPNWY